MNENEYKFFVLQTSLQGKITVQVRSGMPAYISVNVGDAQLFFVEWDRAGDLVHAIQSAMQDHELEYEAECGRAEREIIEQYGPDPED